MNDVSASKIRQVVANFAEKLEEMPIEAHGAAVQELVNGFNYRTTLFQKQKQEEHNAALAKAAEDQATKELEAKFSPGPVRVPPTPQ